MTPKVANPPTPIRADVEVAPAAKGLHDEEDKTNIFLDRERIASAAWMLLLLSKRSPRQREQRELRWLRGGGYYLPSQMRKKRGRAGGGSGSSGDKNECVGEYGETRWAHRWGSISRRNSTKTLQKIFDVINLFQVSEISIVR